MDWHWHEVAGDLKDSMHKGDLDDCVDGSFVPILGIALIVKMAFVEPYSCAVPVCLVAKQREHIAAREENPVGRPSWEMD